MERIPALEAKALTPGLSSNHAECGIRLLPIPDLSLWRLAGLNLKVGDPEETLLLGLPLSIEEWKSLSKPSQSS